MSKYKIKVGNHYHSNWVQRLLGFILIWNRDKIERKVMFEEEAWYPESYVTNRGLNKLFGAGKILHQADSARFAWEPDFQREGFINLHSYVYKDSIRETNFLQPVAVGQWIELGIHKTNEGYMFTFPAGSYDVRHNSPSLRKLLYPYHGGRDTAYRTYVIHIE